MKNWKRKMRAVLAAGVCAATAVTLSGCGKSYEKMIEEEPEEYISMAAENTTKSVVKGNFSDEYLLFKDAAKEGTFTLEFEVEGVKFYGDCYINEKDQLSSQLYTLMGPKGTSASLYVYGDKNLAKFGTEGKSGSHIYDIVYDTLADKLKSSIFAPGSGSQYELSESDYETFLQYANAIAEGTHSGASPYEDTVKAFFEEHPPVTEEKSEVSINGETVEANVFRYDIPKDQLYELAEKLAGEYLEREKNSIAATGATPEETKEELMSKLDDLEDYSLGLVYYVNSASNELMQIDMALHAAEKQPEKSYESDNDYLDAYYDILYDRKGEYDLTVSAVFGADPANAEKQSLVIEIKTDYYKDSDYYSDSIVTISADTTYSENKTETVIEFAEDGKTQETINIVSEKNGENYTVTLDIPEENITAKMEGTIVTDSNSFKMTIDRVSLVEGSAEVSYLPKAVITVKKGGEVLALDSEKEFLDITEEELDSLIEIVDEDIEAVIAELSKDDSSAEGLTDVVQSSELNTLNANAKQIHTASASGLTQLGINNYDFGTEESIASLSFNGVTDDTIKITWDNVSNLPADERLDLIAYLGKDYTGYAYVEFRPATYSVPFALWSEDPIPDEYRHQLTADEQKALAYDGIFIGCYPIWE